jgi:hypothetical protein
MHVRHSPQKLFTAIEEEWDNIPQATINCLINIYAKERQEAYGGHTRY